MNGRVMIMAGGTGGHVYPGLAVAERLRREGIEVSWLGTPAGLEARVVPAAGLELDAIAIGGLRGKGLVTLLSAPVRLLRALGQALAVVRRRRPQAVLGMGGFVTGPGGLAARLLGVPLLIHEQNAVAGLTNRILARLAGRVMEAFPASFGARPALHTGNPVRPEIAALMPPERRFADRDGPLRLLVVGGSLGAAALNGVVPAALARLPEATRPRVCHQTGVRNLEAARAAYGEAGVAAEVVPFIDDMAAAYAEADLVVCRAGAITVAELAAAGVAAILVPFPFAVDDHQTRNAAYLADHGAALLAPQSGLTADSLAALLAGFDRPRLLEMARAARALARPDAVEAVARQVLEAMEVHHG